MQGHIHARYVRFKIGGVATGADAYEKIRAGASAVQLYTDEIGRASCRERVYVLV